MPPYSCLVLALAIAHVVAAVVDPAEASNHANDLHHRMTQKHHRHATLVGLAVTRAFQHSREQSSFAIASEGQVAAIAACTNQAARKGRVKELVQSSWWEETMRGCFSATEQRSFSVPNKQTTGKTLVCGSDQFLFSTDGGVTGECVNCISECGNSCGTGYVYSTKKYCTFCNNNNVLIDLESYQECSYCDSRCSFCPSSSSTYDYCTGCNDDSFFQSTNTTTGTGLCHNCDNDCNDSCPSSFQYSQYCTGCENGHFLHYDMDSPGYGHCHSCQDNCVTPCPSSINGTSTNYCTECQTGYFLHDGYCYECDSNCVDACPTSATEYNYCTSCTAGYFLRYVSNNGTGDCEKCHEGCSTTCPSSTSEGDYCTSCKEGYNKENSYYSNNGMQFVDCERPDVVALDVIGGVASIAFGGLSLLLFA